MSVTNPATEEEITKVDEAFQEDVDDAVAAAKQAFALGSVWRIMDASERGRLMNKLVSLMERDMFHLASIECIDVGKPVKFALFDVMTCVKVLQYYAGLADKTYGKTLPADGNVFTFTRVEPVGVCGFITPWNFPLMLMMHKVAPALAAGCTIVLKSSEKTPLSSLYFASLVKEAGFPPGVFNVLSGFGPTAGQPLVAHMDVDLVSFTGSTNVGKLIQSVAGESNAKRVKLEMGGKSPLVICEDANIDVAAEVAHQAVMINMGQCCAAGTRTFVHESIYDTFIEKARELALARAIGDPFDEEILHGPQVDEIQFNKILDYIEKGVNEGALLLAGGKRFGSKGYFIEPTVFSDVTDDMTIAREEIFGPVQSILKFSTLEEVIERCNATQYGLGAGIVTKDYDKVLQFVQGVRAGTIWVNTFLQLSPQVPFGGFKMSGHGRELGEEGIKDFLEVKAVTMSVTSKNS